MRAYTIKRPEYWDNKLGKKAKKYHFGEVKSPKAKEFDRLSAESLARINQKFNTPNNRIVTE